MNGTFPPPIKKKNNSFFNSIWFGLILGTLAPFCIVLAVKQTTHPDLEFANVLKYSIRYGFVNVFITPGIMINVALMFMLMMLNRDNAAKGVISATFFWGVIIFSFYALQ